MINLLPPTEARASLANYRARLMVVRLYLLLSLILVALVVTASLYWLLLQDYRTLKADLEKRQDQVTSKEYAALNEALERSAKQLVILTPSERAPISLVSLVAILDGHRGKVTITALNYSTDEQGVVSSTINGRAKVRADLLGFISALKSDSQIKRVESPINNLIRDKEIDFVLQIKV